MIASAVLKGGLQLSSGPKSSHTIFSVIRQNGKMLMILTSSGTLYSFNIGKFKSTKKINHVQILSHNYDPQIVRNFVMKRTTNLRKAGYTPVFNF